MAVDASSWASVAAACAGGIVAGELGVRALSSRVGDLLEWRDWECQHKVAAVDALSKQGGASVVAVGASDMNATFDAGLFTEIFGRARPAFNAALNGGNPRTLELWLRDVVLPALRPELVILGTHVAELNDNSEVGERGLTLFRESRGWRRRRPSHGPSERALLWLERRSFLVRYRHFFREPGRWGIKVRSGSLPRRVRRIWRVLRYSVRKDRGRSFSVTALGMLHGLSRFHGVPYQLGTPRMVRSWTEIVSDYSVGDRELAALGRIIDLTRASGADLLVVLMPVMEDWVGLQPGGGRDIDAYKRAVGALVAERRVPFLDLMSGFASVAEYADARHANEIGLEHFTRAVAEVAADEIRVSVRSNEPS